MSLRTFGITVAAVTLLGSASPRAFRAPQVGARSVGGLLDTLDRVRAVRETAISPDGRRVAWVEDVSSAAQTSAIRVRTIGAAAGDVRRVTASNDGSGHQEDGIAWGADGHTLAFLSDSGSPGQQQIYVIDLDGGAPARRVTNVKGQLAQPHWSPDGKQLAVLFVAGSTQGTGALVAYKPDAGVVGDVVEEQRIALVDVSNGTVREVSPANMYVYDYDWSPDGQAFAAEAVEGSGRTTTGSRNSMW